MTLFDEISRTLTDKGREAAQKAKEVAEVLQLKAQVSSEKSRVRDLYAVIGKAYFEQHQEDAQEQYAPAVEEIGKALANIAELEEKIHQLDGSKLCQVCGAVLDKEAAFCSKCGAPASVAGQELAVVGEDAFAESLEEVFEKE